MSRTIILNNEKFKREMMKGGKSEGENAFGGISKSESNY